MSENLAAEVRRSLVALAAERRTILYRDLAARVPVAPPHAIHRLTLALEDLVREDHDAGRPLIAALAVGRSGDGTPGPGFFQLLGELGLYDGPDRGPEARRAHANALDAAFDYWADHAEGRDP